MIDPRLKARAPIADRRREVPDHEAGDVTQVLELSQLPQDNREAQVRLRCRRIDAQLDPQGSLLRLRQTQEPGEPVFRHDFRDRPHQDGAMFVDGQQVTSLPSEPNTAMRSSRLTSSAPSGR